MTDQTEQPQILPISSQKEMVVRTASKILEKWDAQFADYVYNGIKYNTVYTTFSEMYFFVQQFKDPTPVELQTASGVDIVIDFTINDGMRYKEFVQSLKELAGGAYLQSYIVEESKGTHLEQLYTDVEEVNHVIDNAVKYSVGQVKVAFKHWASLLSSHFESDYNLIVETCDINSELRIIGLWTLDANRNKQTEFYINPDYLSDLLNHKFKALNKFSKNADELSETMNAVKEAGIHSRIALGISTSLGQLPNTLSSTKDLLKTCKNYHITSGGTGAQLAAAPTPDHTTVHPVEPQPPASAQTSTGKPLPPPMSAPEEI